MKRSLLYEVANQLASNVMAFNIMIYLRNKVLNFNVQKQHYYVFCVKQTLTAS